MTKAELTALLAAADFPSDAIDALCDDDQNLQKNPETAGILQNSIENYRLDTGYRLSSAADRLMEKSEACGVHPYSAAMLFYLHHAPVLLENYRARYEMAQADALFAGAMADLRAKLFECMAVYHVYGSFVSSWFSLFFSMRLYTLGRLEFMLIPSPFDYHKGELSIKKGEKCIDVHIPSRGALKREELDDAYRQAVAFFAPELKAPIAFHCESWLLFKEHERMLPEHSGIRMFMSDYDYLAEAPDEGDLWRIFGDEDTDHPETLSEDTALRRAYKKHLLAGNPCSGGHGMFFAEEKGYL